MYYHFEFCFVWEVWFVGGKKELTEKQLKTLEKGRKKRERNLKKKRKTKENKDNK